ncbi:MAG: hypothetical protein BM557_05910 [Flavobacterium sp. MedPE-SWcel]|nr:MAG: hypothetical protein BM557_05910 [Flavobacterium sp. MedPE-SWcel]
MTAQKVMSFEEAKEKGIYPAIEDNYKSGIHADSTKAVFKEKMAVEKHIKAYQSFLQDLGVFLTEKKFYWTKRTPSFNRIYINADGTIDYFLYHFRGIPVEKQNGFKALLEEYIKTHKFGVTAPENFSQCSPVTYSKSKE